MDASELAEEIDHALRTLIPLERLVIAMHFLEGYPLDVISQLIGMSVDLTEHLRDDGLRHLRLAFDTHIRPADMRGQVIKDSLTSTRLELRVPATFLPGADQDRVCPQHRGLGEDR